MTIPQFINKRVQTIALILLIAVIAVGGLLLLMSRLAAPKTAPATTHDNAKPVRTVENPQATVPELSNDDEIVATVNDEVISKRDWQQATRLDAAMSRLAFQPTPTAEETLDRLVNEIIVLERAGELPTPTTDEIEAKISALITAWNVTDEAVDSALAAAGLDRTDLTERTGRLLQVKAALNQLAAQEDDLDTWLIRAIASAEIGLYYALVSPPPLAQEVSSNLVPSPASEIQNPKSKIQNLTPASEIQNPKSKIQNLTPASEIQNPKSKIQNPPAPPPDMPVAPYPQNAAPDFTLPQLDGQTLTLSDFRGKPVLVNFWASWCPPCRREMPALKAAYATYGDRIGFVAVDIKESADTVAAFVKEFDLSFPVVLDRDGSVSNVSYEVRGIPTTVFVDANGVVAARHIGPVDEALINGYLTSLLEQPPVMVEQPATEEDDAAAAITINSADDSISISTDGTQPLVSISTGEGQSTAGNQPDTFQPGDDLPPAPDFTLTSGGGVSISLQDYRDKSDVILVFYRTYN